VQTVDATPVAPETVVAVETEPPPCRTLNVTVAPVTARPPLSVTLTVTGSGSAWLTGPSWLFPPCTTRCAANSAPEEPPGPVMVCSMHPTIAIAPRIAATVRVGTVLRPTIGAPCEWVIGKLFEDRVPPNRRRTASGRKPRGLFVCSNKTSRPVTRYRTGPGTCREPRAGAPETGPFRPGQSTNGGWAGRYH